MKKAIINNFKIGTDPEMFLYSNELNKFVPVCGLVGGSKHSPLLITSKGHALQEDNVMVEYCIPPCNNSSDFIKEINFVKNYINDTILVPKNLTYKCVASARFLPSDLTSEQAQEFGCDPDYNAWTGEENVVNRQDPLLRTSGGHIHVGYDDPSGDVNLAIIRAMDLFLTVPSIILDTDTERRKMYGKAGAYRHKNYGVECRTLSTFWTASDDLIKWAFDSTVAAIEYVNSGGEVTNPDDIIDCINNSDKNIAEMILDDYRITIPENLLEVVNNLN